MLLALGTGTYTAGAGAEVHLWDLSTGCQLHTLKGHSSQVVAIRFTPDRKMLISAAWDNTIRVWDVATGKELRQFKGHEAVITDMTLTRDGKTVISSSQDATIRVWDFASGKEVRRIKCNASGISLGPNGRTLAIASGVVFLWDITTGKELRQLGKGDIRGVRFSPDGKILAVSEYSEGIILYDARTGKEQRRVKGREWPPDTAAFSPDGKFLVTAGGGHKKDWPTRPYYTCELKLWDVASGKEVRFFKEASAVTGVIAFSPDGKSVATTEGDFSVRLWDAALGRELPRFAGHAQAVTGLAFSPDGRTLCSSSCDRTIRVWDTELCVERAVLRGHTGVVMAISLAPDGKTLASGSLDGTVRLWDVAARRPIRTLATDHGPVSCLAFSPDGQTLATGDRGLGGTGGTLRLWDWQAGKERYRLPDQGGAHCLSFAVDGKTLAVGYHHSIFVWVTRTGKIRRQLHMGDLRALGYLPDGTVASAEENGGLVYSVRLWDVMAKKELHEWGSAKGGYHAHMAVSPDGRLLAGSFERTIHVWETNTRRKVEEFTGHRRHVSVLTFHPDGRTLASGGADGAILFWDLTGRLQDGKLLGKPLPAAELDLLWKQLGGDAARARQALWTLAASPAQSVPFLRRKLSPVPEVDPKRLARLIADLDAEEFARREKAMRELRGLGEVAVPALRRALDGTPSFELRQRARRLLAPFEESSLPPSTVQALRAVEMLERAGTAEARKFLAVLAKGSPAARLTREARESLQRLSRRLPAPR
jgi:WD40 repeat protein